MIDAVPHQVRELAQQVGQGVPRTETVRTLLNWFGARRRGAWVIQSVAKALAVVGLRTEPDFTLTYLDTEVSFVPAARPQPEPAGPADVAPSQSRPNDAADPTLRLSLLKAANRAPVTVARDTSIREAVTAMVMHDYSQLPVMNGATVVGLFSWKTYGESLALGRPCQYVRECLDPSPLILSPETALLDAVAEVAARDVALVHSRGKLHGIITTSDLSLEFYTTAKPFLLLGSIENNLRAIVSIFPIDVLREARDPGDSDREINGPDDLTFGGYVRLLQRDENWKKVAPTLDRVTFVRQLEEVRDIRNSVMHFHPDPIDQDELAHLDVVLRALQMLRKATLSENAAQ